LYAAAALNWESDAGALYCTLILLTLCDIMLFAGAVLSVNVVAYSSSYGYVDNNYGTFVALAVMASLNTLIVVPSIHNAIRKQLNSWPKPTTSQPQRETPNLPAQAAPQEMAKV